MIKIGQQLSLRVDLLPYQYCEELSKLLDRQAPFPVQQAIERIEAVGRRKLQDVFSAFDPDPIGSASIACVYQGVLKDGTRVAVKVRRPGIGETFKADLKALDIICFFLEFLTILRPGFTKPFRKGLKEALMEEMDFRKEARYQRLFRAGQKKSGSNAITSPKIFSGLSGTDVVTMVYVEGIMLSDVLAAVESQDPADMAALRRMKIRPEKVARLLLRASHMSMISELFFHSDPSPANIIVQKKGRLVFIDFGSCGYFSESQKGYLKQVNHYQYEGDTEGMARATLGLLQPLPHIDIDAFSGELEKIYRTSIYAMADDRAEWWERTTAIYWIAFMRLAIRYKVQLPNSLLHMVRATMLYDTISARLDRNIDFYKEFRKNERQAGKLVMEDVRKKVTDTLVHGIDPKYFLRLEQLKSLGNQLLFRLQNMSNTSPYKFAGMVSKGYYFLSAMIRFVAFTFAATCLVIIVKIISSQLNGKHLSIFSHVHDIFTNTWYQCVLAFFLVLVIRRVLLRWDDKDKSN